MKNPCEEKQCLVKECCTELCEDMMEVADMINNRFHEMILSLKEELQDDEFAKDVYRALSNMRWKYKDYDHKLLYYSCSWRYAGALVAEARGKDESYMDFYCSGNEGFVSEQVKDIFMDKGWTEKPWE
jgi:hypothetical protein